ncbi:hypothetical protein EJB05_22522, partial [Eragrostis curvula]
MPMAGDIMSSLLTYFMKCKDTKGEDYMVVSIHNIVDNSSYYSFEAAMKKEVAPPWLELLLATQFFTTCVDHLLLSRNECNLFCIDCETQPAAFCYCCRSHYHTNHRVIQIRRSSYHNVVRVSEVEDIIDISNVQTYVINSANVVFLNERPQMRGSGASFGKALSSSSQKCETCCRALLDDFRFCSLGCNLKGIKKNMKMPTMPSNGLEFAMEDMACGSNIGLPTQSKQESPNENNDEEPPAKRRHRRKGIPRRA